MTPPQIPQGHRNPTSGCRAKPTMTLECLLSEKHCRVTCPALQLTLLVTMTYDDMLFGSRIAVTNCSVAAAMSISVNTENWMKLLRAIWVLVALMIVTPLAQADGTTKMEFTGVNGANKDRKSTRLNSSH